MKKIIVFKTNISTPLQVSLVADQLNAHRNIHQWSIDIEDIDCVLRIVSQNIEHTDIIQLIKKNGFDCAEL